MTSVIKSMSVIMVLFIALCCGQERTVPFVDDQVKNLREKLDLSDEQVKQIKPILQERNENVRDLHDNSKGTRFEMRESIMEIRAEADKKIKEILTDEQLAKYKEYLEEQRSRRRRFR
jgi:periplasmic protein CpxP/Spy